MSPMSGIRSSKFSTSSRVNPMDTASTAARMPRPTQFFGRNTRADRSTSILPANQPTIRPLNRNRNLSQSRLLP